MDIADYDVLNKAMTTLKRRIKSRDKMQEKLDALNAEIGQLQKTVLSYTSGAPRVDFTEHKRMSLPRAIREVTKIGETVSPATVHDRLKDGGFHTTTRSLSVQVCTVMATEKCFSKVGHGRYHRIY